MRNQNNRKVIVTFKKQLVSDPHNPQEAIEYTRPAFETTEHNIPEVKRIHGKIIKEITLVSNEGTPEEVKVVEKIVEKVVEKTIDSDEALILALAKKNKTPLSIARTLEIPVQEVEKIINKSLTAV